MTQDRFVSYAQNLEDVMLWRALGAAAGPAGFYIDVGAADPTALSVTRAFYDRGWRGLNVEPLPEQAARLTEARPRDITIQAAVADQPGRRRFHRVLQDGQTGLSTLDAAEAAQHEADGAVDEVIDVPVTTLAALCREHVTGPVHFLKIDVEGAEGAVLQGADFTAVRPWIVLVEATKPMSGETTEAGWEPGLLAAGYRFVWFDGLNRFYLADEHAALGQHFTVPPNVFDHYVQFDPVWQDHVAATEALAQRRLAMIETLEAQIAALPAPEPEKLPLPELPPETKTEPAPPDAATPDIAEPPPEQAAIVMRGPARRIAFFLYRIVRPIVRPIAWRSRQFVIASTMQELAAIRAQQDAIMVRLNHIGTGGGGGSSGALNPGLLGAMERLMLTLALENGRDPAPPGLAPAVEDDPPALSKLESAR